MESKFLYNSFYKLKERLGVFDSIIGINEVGFREIQKEYSRKNFNQIAESHGLYERNVDFEKYNNRIYQLYILSVYQQAEQFFKEFIEEYITFNGDPQNNPNYRERNETIKKRLLPFFNNDEALLKKFYKDRNIHKVYFGLREERKTEEIKSLAALTDYFKDIDKANRFISFINNKDNRLLYYFSNSNKETLLIQLIDIIKSNEKDFIKEVGEYLYHGFNYYRLVRNYFMHNNSEGDEDGDTRLTEVFKVASKYKSIYKEKFNVEAPNSYKDISFDDFKLFSNLTKRLAEKICNLKKPLNERLVEELLKGEHIVHLTKKKKVIRVKDLIKNEKGLFVEKDSKEVITKINTEKNYNIIKRIIKKKFNYLTGEKKIKKIDKSLAQFITTTRMGNLSKEDTMDMVRIIKEKFHTN